MAGIDFNDLSTFQSEFSQMSSQADSLPSYQAQTSAMNDIQDASQAMSFDPQLAMRLLKDAQQTLFGNANAQSGNQAGSMQPCGGSNSPVMSNPAQAQSTGQVGGTTPSLSVNGNSINTGMYTIAGSTNDDGSLTITNNQTGQQTEVWGDPHVKVNGQDTAEFQKGPLNIQLQDGTTVHIDPTALTNGVAHIGQVSVTNGNQTVTMGGVGQNGFQGGVNTSQVMNGISNYSSGLYNAPNATDITLGSDGNLYYNNANGSMGNEITAKADGGETDLDGQGGGLVGHPGTSNTVSNSDMLSTVQNLLEGLANTDMDSFQSTMMQTTLQQMDKNLQSA